MEHAQEQVFLAVAPFKKHSQRKGLSRQYFACLSVTGSVLKPEK